jgi:hypothetical protein
MREAFYKLHYQPMCDFHDLRSLGLDLPYRHQSFWETMHYHEEQDSLCAVAEIRSVQSF